MAKKLDRYRSKRRAGKTPEPDLAKGTTKSAKRRSRARFVVHEHHARSLHWDLRLERDGVLVSWAIPRGIPADPKRNNLAVHVEDHPLDYIDFEGEIPAGNYGAGEVKIWDSGTYEEHKFRRDEVIITFHGERLEGKYVLFQTDGKNWMIHRMDPPEDPTREPLPQQIEVMSARLGDLPSDPENYGFEIKWDGVRALAYCSGGRLRLESRKNEEITRRYPELRELGRLLGMQEAVFDGEVVAFDSKGRPSFQRLQERMHLTSEGTIRRLAERAPVTYIIFDLLFYDGHPTLELPYRDRRRLLSGLAIEGSCCRVPDYYCGEEAEAILAASRELGLEGVVAKRLDSHYLAGKRSSAWLKIKNHLSQEFVICGYLPGKGTRSQTIGSLSVGVWDEGVLRYCGQVGSGFTASELERLRKLLFPLRRGGSPFGDFDSREPTKEVVFLEPRYVADIAFSGWTADHSLRHPVYRGLREDKNVAEVVRESRS